MKEEALAKLWELDEPMRVARIAMPHHGIMLLLAQGWQFPTPEENEKTHGFDLLLEAGLLEIMHGLVQITPAGITYVNTQICPELMQQFEQRINCPVFRG